VKADALHGDMSQAARERSLAKFADGTLTVLVATDVAARGIDIDDVAAVVHYEPPIEVFSNDKRFADLPMLLQPTG
ncbi:MAG: helicase-related protein, partial [Actinomycetota bacterium]